MIITKLRLQEEHPMTSGVNSYPLPVVDLDLDIYAGTNGYLAKNVEGLHPTEMTAIVVGFDSSGRPIKEPSAEKRVIVALIKLEPGVETTFGELRDKIYRYLGRSVQVTLMNESLSLARTTGFVQNIEAEYFSNQPELTLTIECVDGSLAALDSVTFSTSKLDTATPVLDYSDGTAPTGLDLVFEVSATHSNFTIYGHNKLWYTGEGAVDNHFNVTYDFLAGDIITMSTTPRNERLTLLRDDVTYDLAGYINSGAVWPRLYSGVNSFSWDLTGSWMDWVSGSYTPRFWGV